ncbi:hypothetical protein FLA_2294 [Filimonas lacunae]|nr:hypothetical protein FLA_2294 [Filimonas lacunae]
MAAGVSCKKDMNNWNPDIVQEGLTVTISYADTSYNSSLPKNNFPVIITSERSSVSDTLYTDVNGLVHFTPVERGKYIVTTYRKFSDEEMLAYTGIAKISAFNGSASSVAVGEGGASVELSLIAGDFGSLVFKQLYYAGSGSQGALQRDQFVEIYNNSADTIYADSLYFGTVQGINSTYDDLNPATTTYITSDTRQYNWSKSLVPAGMPAHPSDANTSYLYAGNLFRIPGNGTTYPIAPGNSIIIAASALNHKAPYTAANGSGVTVVNPDLTVDLSGADFEVYLRGVITTPSPTDVDNPAPNLVMIKVTGTELTLSLQRNGFFIFKTTEDVAAWPSYPSPNVSNVTASTALFKRVPKKYIIDAVETQYTTNTTITSSDLVPAKLSSELDAGYGYCIGSNNSQVLMRKTDSTTVDGRRILVDTNNSSNDFERRTRAVPRGF